MPNELTSQTINGLTVNINEDKSVTINGTATKDTKLYLSQNKNIDIESGTVRLSTHKNGSLTGALWFTAIDSNNIDKIALNVSSNEMTAREITEDWKLGGAYLNISANALLSDFTIYPMLIIGGTNEEEYEAYGVSPSPEYPSPIHSLGDDVNEFDKNNANYLDGYIDTDTITANSNYRTYYKPCSPNTTYTISRTGTSTIYIAETSSLPTLGGNIDNKVNGTSESATIITSSTATYIVFQVYRNNYDDLETVLNTLKLQKGTVSTPYSSYGKGTIEVKQEGINLLKYPYVDTTLTMNGITFTDNKDGTITINGTATGGDARRHLVFGQATETAA